MKRGRKSVAEMQLGLMAERPPSLPLIPGTEAFSLAARGYTPHEGTERPAGMSHAAMPGVVFDDGSFLKQGEREAQFIDWSRVRGFKLRDYQFQQNGFNFGTRKREK